MQIACFKCKLHIACRAGSPRADVLVAAEDVGRVPVAFEGGQAVVLGGAVGAADGGLVELAQVVDVVDRGGEGAQGGHGLAAPGDPSRVVGGVLPDGLGEQPEGGVAAAEGGGVLGDPAEGAAKRQQPDLAVGAGGLGEQDPDLVDRFGGKGLQQQALPVVALAPAVVVVALGLEVEVGPGAEGVERRSKGAQRGQVALGAGQGAAV